MAGINLRAASGGLGRLAAAIGGGQGTGSAYERGMHGEMGLQSKLAQAMAQIEASNATAELNRVKADGERSEQAMRTPEAVRRTAMVQHGIPLDEAPEVDGYFRTGQLGGKYRQLPAEVQGPVAPQPDWMGRLSDVARAMAGTQRALTIGDKNSENVAKAAAIERQGRLSDAIIAGTANRNTVGGAQAAVEGKDLFNSDATGSVLDRFTGSLDTNNPMAGSTIRLRTEQAGQAKAGAAENYAQADSARASASKTREEMGRARGGDVVQVVRPDGAVWLVNKTNGLARPVVDADGNAVTTSPKVAGGKGGAGAGAGKTPAEIQRMAIAMDALEKGLDSYENEMRNFNPRSTDQASTSQRAKLKSLMADIKMQYKEAQALGALTGPDLAILDQALTDPTSMMGILYGNGGLKEQLGQAREGVNRRREALANQYPGNPAFAPGGGGQNQADPLGLFTKPTR